MQRVTWDPPTARKLSEYRRLAKNISGLCFGHERGPLPAPVGKETRSS